MAVVLITGASSGIGRALARRMAARGHVVGALARRQPLLEELVGEIAAAGGRGLALPCDVTDRQAVHAAIERARADLGPIEVLVANAGGGRPTHVDSFRAAQLEAQLQLNVVGAANCIEAVLPDMLARQEGHLVAVSSLAGRRGLPTGEAYAASKAALDVMMESLRVDLRSRGLAVTVVSPGPVRLKPNSKKSRLFSVDVEEAAARIEAAIHRRAAWCSFPRTLALALALTHLLPAPVYDRLLAGRGRAPKPPPATTGD